MLIYKSYLKGGLTVKINRWLPSTKTCSSCGHVKYVSLDERTYICPECHMEMDRDVNAAKNILNFGLTNTAGTAVIYACGVDARPSGIMPVRRSTKKQEKRCGLPAEATGL